MAENQETLDTIAERQRRLETGQLVLSALVEELVEKLGGNSIPAKFRSREQFIENVAARARRIDGEGGLVGRATQIAADRHRAAQAAVLVSRTNRPLF